MNVRHLWLFLLLVVVQGSIVCSAQDNQEVESLKKRVADLESQNRQILQLLSQMGVKIGDASAVQAVPPVESGARAATIQNPPITEGSVPTSLGSRAKIYGMLRADMDVDSQRPNNGETPLYIVPADAGTGKSDRGLFSLHPRLTRFGLDLNGPSISSLRGPTLTGKFESDFENGGSESRQIIRVRQAYVRLGWNNFSILAGQTWDIVSPLNPTVNDDTLMWNAGNIGDRRPQVRADWEVKNGRGVWSLASGVGLTGAVDALDVDNSGYLSGQESGRPDLQARAGYSHPMLGQKASLGGSFYYGWLNASKPAAGRTSFTGQATNIDYTLPLAAFLSLRGEGWWGRNLSDVRGGAGQGINTTTGTEIRARGGWSELSLSISRYWSIHPGLTTDNPLPADVPSGGRTRNAALYFGNRFSLSPLVTLGADYLRWKTNYKGPTPAGIDNRVNLFLLYRF